MGFFCVSTAALRGVQGERVTVEVDITRGLPKFHLVGLPDAAVSESRERVRAAITRSGFSYPRTAVTVNLAPADLRKSGPLSDLAIALGVLGAHEELSVGDVKPYIIVGELALDGGVRGIRGILPCALLAKSLGIPLILPLQNLPEARFVHGVELIPVENVHEAWDALQGKHIVASYQPPAVHVSKPAPDFSAIAGQALAKRALEIAAAGGHNVLMSGSPGSGKTLLARAFPSILPELDDNELLEVAAIHSIAGTWNTDAFHERRRPLRAPHHTASGAALVGGGAQARPGEISLAHRGVLFLDELPEFSRTALENLRQPLEDGIVSIVRAMHANTYPARFILLAAMNPCPCGFLRDTERQCTCPPHLAEQYARKISGPLLDRIDLHMHVPRVAPQELLQGHVAEISSNIKNRVLAARAKQRERYAHIGITTNAEITNDHLRTFCTLTPDSQSLIERAMTKGQLSARGYARTLKVSRTIADLTGETNITSAHILEALQYKQVSVA